MNTLGERVKSLRENMNITQQELGNIVKLHGSNIGRIEKGKVFPTSDVLLKISTYFNVSCDWLLTGSDAKTHFCDNADEINLINLYRRLTTKDQADIQEMMEFKLYKAEKKKEKPTSSTSGSTTADDVHDMLA
ncbi:MAG: helix-turn-helix transcriptional regulator [Lachnospiraceae bacterium]|jgi:transcriptional regulator with XRE-family HTH domain|nr:helix-turn-helix transcriptional regulator [Lachnospiraceae bacterium]